MFLFISAIEDDSERHFMESLYHNHMSRMYNTANKILNDKNDAEDAVQESLIRIYKNIDKFISLPENELCLLICIYTKNEAKRILKRRSGRRDVSLVYGDDNDEYDIADQSPDLDEIVIRQEICDNMVTYINELPEAQRHVVILKYRYNMVEREIAESIGITEVAVGARLLRAKNRLRKLIGDEIV